MEHLVKVNIEESTRQAAKVKAASRGMTLSNYLDLLVRADMTPGPHYYGVSKEPRPPAISDAVTGRSPAAEDGGR